MKTAPRSRPALRLIDCSKRPAARPAVDATLLQAIEELAARVRAGKVDGLLFHISYREGKTLVGAVGPAYRFAADAVNRDKIAADSFKLAVRMANYANDEDDGDD